jgi:hypothetical protein
MQKHIEDHTVIEAIKAENDQKAQKLLKQKTIRANVEARKQAKLRGDNTYLGTPCSKEGHGAVRKTYNGVCRECHRLQNIEYRARNKAELAELRAAVYGKEVSDY